MAKNKKIETLQKSLRTIEEEEFKLREELRDFNDTKVSLKSKKELIFKMQEKMNILEDKEKLHGEKVDTLVKDFQTLTFKHKGIQKRNEFLVEENSRIRIDYTKILLKTSHQERRIFEKLISSGSSKGGHVSEIEKLADAVYEKNRKLYDALQHEAVGVRLSPLSDDISRYQKELMFGYEKSMGKERNLHQDMVSHIKLYQKIEEDIMILSEKLKEEENFENFAAEVFVYILDASGIDQKKFVEMKDANEETEVYISLPNDQNLMLDTSFSLAAYEAYLAELDASKKAEKLSDYLSSIKKHMDKLVKKSKKISDESYCWMLIPEDEALSVALKQESRLYDKGLKKSIILVDPTMLLVTLQGVAMLWDYKYHYKQADALMTRVEAMYGQFEVLGIEMSDASQRLKMLQESLPLDI